MMQWRDLFGSGDYRHSSSQDRKLFFSSSSSSSVPTLSLLKRRCALLVRRKRGLSLCAPSLETLDFVLSSLICVLHAGQSCTFRHRVMVVESKGCPLAYAKLYLTQSTALLLAFNATWNHLAKRIIHVSPVIA